MLTVIKKDTKYSGQYTRVSCWVKQNEIHSVSNGQRLVVTGESRVVFCVKRNRYMALLQDHFCSMLNLCTFCFCQGDGHLCQTFRGMILRSQLIALLKNKIFNESHEIWNCKELSLKMFRDEYPRHLTIQVQDLPHLFCVPYT